MNATTDATPSDTTTDQPAGDSTPSGPAGYDHHTTS